MLNQAHSHNAGPSGRPYSPTHRQHRKYAKIICHLRDDVADPTVRIPDSACIHQLAKKYFQQAETALSWEEAICKLLSLMKADPICQSEDHNYSRFFQKAILQVRRATSRDSIWCH